jgi:predicted HD superfamily hydrolase involved in NAD metabolism
VSLAPKADIDMDVVRAAVQQHLSPRSASSRAVRAVRSQCAALRFDVDPDAAELAGLLHDWSRDDSFEDLLSFADRTGLAVFPEEREHPYLLHARVAADQLRQEFPDLTLPVLSAVAAHTVGAVPMTPLDEIVYIADAIEPDRDYSGVDELRQSAARETLEVAFADAYARSVAHVRRKGAPLHPMTALVVAGIERNGVSAPSACPAEDDEAL